MKQIIFVCFAVIFMSWGHAVAMPNILTTDQIYPGMTGIAKTVVKGSDITTFDVEIIGIVDSGKGAAKAIMARASGPVIDAAGGILQGMSGSPVYINDKLIGAAASGFKDMDPRVFFITPISDMLEIWKYPDKKNKTTIEQIDLKKLAEDNAKKIEEDMEKVKKAEANLKKSDPAIAALTKKESIAADKKIKKNQPAKAANGKTAEGIEPKTTVFVSGFGDAGFSFLKKKLAPLGFEPSQLGGETAGASGKVDYNPTLEPGSAVGVALAYGDFSIGATGTVTAVDGNRILAFGHPFTHKGNVNYFMTDADVIGTISGVSNGMKIATVGNIIGRINQDRNAGIAGILGSYPSVVPIKVTIKNNTMGTSETYESRMAYDEDFLPILSAGIAYASLEKSADRLGESTAKVHFEIRTDAVAGGKMVRDNMFYNAADVGQVAVSELGQGMSLVCANTDKESDILDVKVDVTLDGDRRTASIIGAVPDKFKVKPGDVVNFKTTIKPYRKAVEVLKIPYTIPKMQAAGTMNLEFRGGGLVPATQLLLMQTGIDMSPEEDKQKTTAEKIKDFLSTDKNNEIVITPAAPPIVSEEKQKKMIEEAIKRSEDLGKEEAGAGNKKKKEMPAYPEAKFATSYVIDNVIHVSLQVEKKS
ncbi:MAG: SpoIVB peptidase S55 domain-containing protein [Selenomonadaceae bacterium]